jgi:hypothetical protein
MGCQEPEEQLYIKCLPVEKKIEQDIQISKKRRKLEVLSDLSEKHVISDINEEQILDVSTT